ncbi:pilus assembly protein [Bacillus sp. DNRA2]|uniref:TadE/TadG family type IV pilus assembly protein n=1 Tax=Bacillus sp. DNRA2 TaxID=2723053 RepID=UPI00145E46D2|nr:TadE/TadG family type IV pilus assembly protein [Bacillus sp. DNRA2]NMD70118.1 pilus assembly protein [Bacillus sp. DNRA2]
MKHSSPDGENQAPNKRGRNRRSRRFAGQTRQHGHLARTEAGQTRQHGHLARTEAGQTRQPRRLAHSEAGQATVELALSLLVLLLIVFAIIDFGRIFQAYLTTEHATREGARLASLGATDTEITTATKTAAQVDEAAKLTVTVTPQQDLRKRGTYVTVATSYPVTISVPLMEMILPNPFTVKSKTVMRVE